MSAPDIGITDADRRKMGEWAENGVRSDAQRGVSRNRPKAPEEDDMADPERTTADKDVTRRKCERIRERSLDGEPYSAIADDLHLSLSTISRHVTGKCSHERAVTIDDRRCAVIRSLAHDGMSYAEIARELGWGERQTISDHGRGFCSHDIDIPPLNNRE